MKGRTLRRWQFSYFLILLLPLLFGSVIYFRSLSTIRRETEELQYQLLLQDETVLKNLLGQLRDAGNELVNNSYVKNLAVAGISPELERERIGMVQSLLKSSLSANEALSNVYLFFPKRGLVMNSQVSFRMTEEMWIQDDIYLSDPAVGAVFDENPYNRLFFLSGSKSDVMLYSFSGNYKDRFADQDIVLLYFLNRTWLAEQFPGTDSAVLLETAEGDIRKIGGGIPEEEDWNRFAAEEGRMRHQGGYAVLKRELTDYRIALYCIRRDWEYRKEIFVGAGILAVYVVVCLSLGTYLASVLSKRNYKPVDEILTMIRKGAAGGEAEDEFEIIRSRLQKLLDGYERKTEEISKQEQAVQDGQMGRFLLLQKNKYAQLEEENEKRLKELLPKPNYAVVQFDLEDVEEALQGERLNEESLQLLYFILRNVSGDLLGEEYPFLSGSLGGYCYFILNGEKAPEDFVRIAEEKIGEVCAFLKETYGFQVYANISRAGTGLSEVAAGYGQVRRLNEYRNYVGTPFVVLSYGKMERVLKEADHETAAEEDGIAGSGSILTKAGLQAEQENIIREEAFANCIVRETSSAREQGRRIARIGNIKKAGDSAKPEGKKEGGGRLDQTLPEILSYLENHYMDKQLTVAAVAEHFEMNMTYLSRVFKKKTGSGVLDYINRLRVEKAKELLGTGKSVKDTADEVGYYTVRPLMRAFRDQLGMTPGEYAKLRERG